MVRPLFQMTTAQAVRQKPVPLVVQKPDAYSIMLALSTRRLASPYAGYAASLMIPFSRGLPCRGQRSARWYAERAGADRPGFLMAITTKLLTAIEKPAHVDLFLPGKTFEASFEAEEGAQQIPRAIRLAYEAALHDVDLRIDVLDSKSTPRFSQVQRLLDQTPESKVFENDAFRLIEIDLEAYEALLSPESMLVQSDT